jgi:hypothetical protein
VLLLSATTILLTSLDGKSSHGSALLAMLLALLCHNKPSASTTWAVRMELSTNRVFIFFYSDYSLI